MVTLTGQILNSGICKLILDALRNTVVMFFKLLILVAVLNKQHVFHAFYVENNLINRPWIHKNTRKINITVFHFWKLSVNFNFWVLERAVENWEQWNMTEKQSLDACTGNVYSSVLKVLRRLDTKTTCQLQFPPFHFNISNKDQLHRSSMHMRQDRYFPPYIGN